MNMDTLQEYLDATSYNTAYTARFAHPNFAYGETSYMLEPLSDIHFLSF